MITQRSITGNPPLRRPPRAQRGQALIMAVLLMFLLVGLAGVFIAMIRQAQTQTARSAERYRLEQVAQAGMMQAESGLRNSANGADWRPSAGPDDNNKGWQYDPNGGFYKVTVSYGGLTPYSTGKPFLQNPLDRYLKVDVEARFTLDNPPRLDPNDPLREKYQEAYESGRLLNTKFLTRTITAYVPIALTDYLVWVTNLYESSEPSVLGPEVTLSTYEDPAEQLHTVRFNPVALSDENLNATANATAIPVSYLSTYDGPIRSETDLGLGNVRIDITQGDGQTDSDSYITNFNVRRHDIVEVLGQLNDASSVIYHQVMVNAHDLVMNPASPPIISPDRKGLDPINEQNNILLVQYLQTADNTSEMPTLRAPKFGQAGLQRYRTLTRDSGYAMTTAINTGYIGWGQGLYINNSIQIQYDGDIGALREEWTDNTGGCWEMGVYRPYEKGSAVQLILHDWEYAGATAVSAPYLELQTTVPNVLFHSDGVAVTATITGMYSRYSLTMPYPKNGVIFAEGNLAVSGDLPASVAYESSTTVTLTPIFDADGNQSPGGRNAQDGSIHYYLTPTNRRFDLTIVSAGTVYVEGNLLCPSSRRSEFNEAIQQTRGGHYLVQSGGWTRIANGSEWDSKAALLAADNVCLNPTRLFADFRNADGSVKPKISPPAPDWYWSASAANTSFTFTFASAGPLNPRMRLLLRHAGANDATHSATTMRMYVNNDHPFLWGGLDPTLTLASAVNLQFCASAEISSLYPWITTTHPEAPEWPDKLWGGGRFLPGPFGMQSWRLGEYSHYTGVAGILDVLNIYGRPNTLRFTWFDNDPADGADYLLHAGTGDNLVNDKYASGCIVTGLDVQVDALIYAQRGSWFIIPGQYWYDQAASTPQPTRRPFPGYREPYDVRITLNGAISENATAPEAMQRQWIEHWRGSNIWYFDTNGDGMPDKWDPANAGWDTTAWRWKDPSTGADNRRQGITYIYDATLARPVCYDVDPDDPSIRYYTPRLPKLPVGPELLTVQESQST